MLYVYERNKMMMMMMMMICKPNSNVSSNNLSCYPPDNH